jgi:hypothetical protein
MGEAEARQGTTEALFREVNERIAETAARFGADEAEFVCECSDSQCAHKLTAALDEYEQVREEPTHFLLHRGHEERRIERVVRSGPEYAVVEKFQETVARIARAMNPRAAEG